MTELTGGCGCRAVRYRITGPTYDAPWCHCRNCQLASGAPAMAFVTAARAHVVIDSGDGAIGSHASSDAATRGFCTRCGTSLTFRTDYQPDEIDVALATLDAPAAVPPLFHLFYDRHIAWAPAGDDRPRYDGFGIAERGLAKDARPA